MYLEEKHDTSFDIFTDWVIETIFKCICGETQQELCESQHPVKDYNSVNLTSLIHP